MTAAWRAALEDARRPRTVEQVSWDAHFDRWQTIARRSGRDPNESSRIAWTRTEAQYGARPTNPKETDR